MDNSNAAHHLMRGGVHPADAMVQVSNVAAFLETALVGEHVNPEGTMTLGSDAMEGLAHIMGLIRSTALRASDACKD